MGWSHPDEDSRADHYRDERKHDIPLHAEPKPMTTAMEVALLVKLIPIETGAALIQQFADTVAAGARVEEAQIACERAARALESPLSKEPV